MSFMDSPTRPALDLDAVKRANPLVHVVGRTVKLKRTGNEWVGLCPFHAERTPSFTIYDNGQRWHCHGACSRGGDVLDFVMARDGVDLPRAAESLCAERSRRRDNGAKTSNEADNAKADHGVYLKPGQQIVATFEWLDRDGRLHHRTHRVEPGGTKKKEFKPDRPDGRGGWIGDLDGLGRIPYRFDRLAADRTSDLYVAEGEAKADRLLSWGLLATSHRHWHPDFAEYLRGRQRVFILPDNDAAGAGYAEKMAEMVGQAGAEPIIVRLAGLAEGGDILDWRGGPDELAGEIAKAIGKDDALPSLDLAQLATERPTAKRFAIPGIAPVAEVTLFTGPGSAGRSLLAQQFVTAAAAGLPCLGLDVAAGPAIYVTCEDDPGQLHWRQAHICDKMSVDMASLAGKLHLVSLRGALDNELGTFCPKGTLTPSAAYHRLVAKIKASGARLAFLDNLSHLFTGNENDRGQVTRFVNLLNRLAGETGAAIVLLAHTPKPPKAGEASHDYSGSTAWVNAVRSQFKIDHVRNKNGEVVDRDLRAVTIGKANYSRTGEAMRLIWEDWCFILESQQAPDRAAERAELGKINAENGKFLECLAKVTEERRNVSHARSGSNYAPRLFAGMTIAKGFSEKGLAEAMERLLHLGTIKANVRVFQYDNRTWATGIGLAAEAAQNPAQNPHKTPPEGCTTPQSDPSAQSCTEAHKRESPYTTYMSGAAHGAAAPEQDEDLDWGPDGLEADQ